MSACFVARIDHAPPSPRQDPAIVGAPLRVVPVLAEDDLHRVRERRGVDRPVAKRQDVPGRGHGHEAHVGERAAVQVLHVRVFDGDSQGRSLLADVGGHRREHVGEEDKLGRRVRRRRTPWRTTPAPRSGTSRRRRSGAYVSAPRLSEATSWSSASTSPSTLAAAATTASPCCVRRGTRPDRSNRRSPSCASRRSIDWLTAACTRPSLRAAAEKLPASTTARSVRSCSMVTPSSIGGVGPGGPHRRSAPSCEARDFSPELLRRARARARGRCAAGRWGRGRSSRVDRREPPRSR